MATKEKEQLDESGVPFEIPKGVRRQFARRGKIYWMGSVVKKNRKWGGDKRYCVITRTGVYLVKSGKLSRCILHSQIDTLVDLIAAEDEKLVAVKTREGLHDFVVEVGLDVNQKVRKDEFENSLKEAYFASTHTHLRSVELSEASGEKKTEFLNLKPAPKWKNDDAAGILPDSDEEVPGYPGPSSYISPGFGGGPITPPYEDANERADRQYMERTNKLHEDRDQQQHTQYPPAGGTPETVMSMRSGTSPYRSARPGPATQGQPAAIPSAHNPHHSYHPTAAASPVVEDAFAGSPGRLDANVNPATLRVNNATLISPRRNPTTTGASAGMPTPAEQYHHAAALRPLNRAQDPIYQHQQQAPQYHPMYSEGHYPVVLDQYGSPPRGFGGPQPPMLQGSGGYGSPVGEPPSSRMVIV